MIYNKIDEIVEVISPEELAAYMYNNYYGYSMSLAECIERELFNESISNLDYPTLPIND